MIKVDIEKIFIWGSILFLLTMVSIFSYRFIHFYQLSHNSDNIIKNVYDIVLAKENSHNFYKSGDSYFYRGKTNNNYVIYSGIVWRIMKLENNNLTLISDIPITNLYFDDTYADSSINKFLNENFYELLDKSSIIDTSVCVSNETNISECKEEYTAKVVLPSFQMYDKAGGIDSFINNGYYMYLSDRDTYKYYINDHGKIDKTVNDNMYGIKPVITISSRDIINGDGSVSLPYLLDNSVTVLKDAFVGNYVYSQGNTYRITDNSEEFTELVLNDKIEVSIINKEYRNGSDIYNYLNDEYYNSLDNDKIINTTWFNGYYDSVSNIEDSTVQGYVRFMNINDLFINDISNHTLMSTSNIDDMDYVIKGNGIIYKEEDSSEYGIRPMFRIKNNFIVTGEGTKENPYIIGEELNEEDY